MHGEGNGWTGMTWISVTAPLHHLEWRNCKQRHQHVSHAATSHMDASNPHVSRSVHDLIQNEQQLGDTIRGISACIGGFMRLKYESSFSAERPHNEVKSIAVPGLTTCRRLPGCCRHPRRICFECRICAFLSFERKSL